MPWRSNVRFRLLTLSHQTIVWIPTGGPSRRTFANIFAGGSALGSSSYDRDENPKSSSDFRRSRNRWMS